MKYYAGRQVKINGETYSVGDTIPKAEKLRFLEAMISSGQIYAVPTGKEAKTLPPHVFSRVKTKEFHKSVGENKNIPQTEAAAQAVENHENDTTVKRSRAEAEVSEALSKVVAAKGTLKRDLQAMRKAEMSFGKSVVDDSKATTPDKAEGETPQDQAPEPEETSEEKQDADAPSESQEKDSKEGHREPKAKEVTASKAKTQEPKKTTARKTTTKAKKS